MRQYVHEKIARGVITDRVEKYVGKFTMGRETHSFTVLKARDLACLRPLDMETFDWDSAISTLLPLKTKDVAFEMRRD